MLPNSWGPATILTVALVAIVAIAGAVIAILHPSELSFQTYAEDLLGGAGATGLLAIGRGLITPTTTTTALPAPTDAATTPGVVVSRAPS